MNQKCSPENVSSQKPRFPAGPKLPALLQMLSYMRDPTGVLKRYQKNYGSWYTVRYPRVPPIVVTSSLKAIKQLLKASGDDVHAGEAVAPLFEPILGASSLFVLDGKKHLKQRRLMLPAFRGERMKQYFPEIQAPCQKEFSQWSPDTSFSLMPKMQNLTLSILLKSVFGLNEGRYFDELHSIMREFIKYMLHPVVGIAIAIPVLRIPFGPWGKMTAALQEIRHMLQSEIQKRRNNGSTSQHDILSVFISARDEDNQQLSDNELIDEMLTLLVAGHDTTALSISWFWHDILSHPDCYQKLKNEFDSVLQDKPLTVSQLDQFKYLDATIKESMRIHPVASGFMRRLKKPMVFDEVSLPEGTTLFINLYALNNDPQHWEEPGAFKPERFLTDAASNAPLFPFGGGIRRCIGKSFSLFEMKIMIIEMLKQTRLSLVDEKAPKIILHGSLLAPKKGVIIKNH